MVSSGQIKKAQKENKSIVFIDESGFMLQPNLVKTWAPVGHTPILKCWDRRDRVSVISAITIAPHKKSFGVYFSVYDENIRNPHVTKFLKNVRRTLGRELIVVLDRLSAHRTAANKLLKKPFHKGSYCFEFLPAYAPELNPVEFLWCHTKTKKMANYAPDNIYELDDRLNSTFGRTSKALVMSAFKHSELEL